MARRSNYGPPSLHQSRPSSLVAVEEIQRSSLFSTGPRESMRNSGRQSLRRTHSFNKRDSQLNMNAAPFVPNFPNKSSQRSLGPVQEECRRVRKQIEKLATDLAHAFSEELYDQVKDIGERKKKLEDQLEKFEAQYAKDQKDIATIKAQIAGLKEQIEESYKNEDFTQVKELGDTKKKLQQELADIEANFGLANEQFYKVGDHIELTGLQTPRGSLMNGTPGIIREYMPKEKRYKIEILNDDGTSTYLEWSGSSRDSAIRGAQAAGHTVLPNNLEIAPALLSPKGSSTWGGSSNGSGATRGGDGGRGSMIAVQPKNIRKRKDYQTQPGEIKLWFPKKHFGFITPDHKEADEPDIFFHGSHVLNSKEMPIRRYSKVTFRIIPAPKGPQARDVSILSHQLPEDREKQAAQREPQKAPAGSVIPPSLYSPRAVADTKAAGPPPEVEAGATKAPPPEKSKDETAKSAPPGLEGSAGATTTEDFTLPPLDMVAVPGQMERWASCKSTDEMDFSGAPPNLDTPSSKVTQGSLLEDNGGSTTSPELVQKTEKTDL